MPVYRGPADVFIHGGKEYHQGDNIPISKEAVAHHVREGHRFEGNDPDVAPAQPQPAARADK
jgi:hypothetical protein